jgi:hypothetical protein
VETQNQCLLPVHVSAGTQQITDTAESSAMLQIYSLEFAAHTSAIKSLCIENGIPVEIVATSPMTGDNKTPQFLKVEDQDHS